MRFLLLVLAIAGTLGVFAMTRSGHALLKRLGFRRYVPGSAPARDVEYLRSLCGGDPAETEERLEAEPRATPRSARSSITVMRSAAPWSRATARAHAWRGTR